MEMTMKIICNLVLGILLFANISYATLTPGTVPVTKTGGSSPVLQNGSITDTGTASGAGNVGIGSTNPSTTLDVNGTVSNTGEIVNGNVGIGTINPINPLVVNGSASFLGLGNVGIGSTIPGQALDVNGTMRSTGVLVNGNVGIGTASAGNPLVIVGSAQFIGAGNVGIGTTSPNNEFVLKGSSGHQWGTPIPVVTSCGTSPTIKGTDNDFQVQVGSVSATGCTITFGRGTYQDATCILENQSLGVVNAFTYTVSSTAVVASQTGLTGAILNGHCDFKN